MKYPAYFEYSLTHVHPLRRLPSHWALKRLRFATQGIEQGWSPQCDNLPADDDAWGVMKVGCVNGNGFDPRENKALPAEFEPLTEYELRPRDVLVSRANTKELVGSAAVVPADVRPKLLLCDKLFRLRTEDDVHQEFLTYFLRTPTARFHYERDATGASDSMQNIGQATLKNLALPLPPLDEQEHIAVFLDWKTSQIDALIAKKIALVDRLKEARQALIYRAVTQGLDSDVPMRNSSQPWIGEVPAHWEVVPLGFLVELLGGMTPSMANGAYWDGEIPWVTPKDMKRPSISDSFDHITDLALKETGLRLVPLSSVLVVVRGMILAHSFPTAITAAPVTINQDMKALRCGELLDVEYLFWCLTGFTSVLCNLAQESAHGTRKMETDTLKKFSIPVPPLDEQRAITRYLQSRMARLDRLAKMAKDTHTRLTEYRSALITAATTGQIDLRYVDIPDVA